MRNQCHKIILQHGMPVQFCRTSAHTTWHPVRQPPLQNMPSTRMLFVTWSEPLRSSLGQMCSVHNSSNAAVTNACEPCQTLPPASVCTFGC